MIIEAQDISSRRVRDHASTWMLKSERGTNTPTISYFIGQKAVAYRVRVTWSKMGVSSFSITDCEVIVRLGRWFR
jgi:hypothetical protein